MKYLNPILFGLLLSSSLMAQGTLRFESEFKSIERIKFISDANYRLVYLENGEYSIIVSFENNVPVDTIKYDLYNQSTNDQSKVIGFDQDVDFFYIYIRVTQIYGNEIKVNLLKYSKQNKEVGFEQIATYEGPLHLISSFKDQDVLHMILIDQKTSTLFIDTFSTNSFSRVSIPYDKKLNIKPLRKERFKYMAENHSFINGYDKEQIFKTDVGFIFLVANTSYSKHKIMYYELNLIDKNIELHESTPCIDCSVSFKDNLFFTMKINFNNIDFSVLDREFKTIHTKKFNLNSIGFLNNPVFKNGKIDSKLMKKVNNKDNPAPLLSYLNSGILLNNAYDFDNHLFGFTIGGYYYPSVSTGYATGAAGSYATSTSGNRVIYSTTIYINKTDFEIINRSPQSNLIGDVSIVLQPYARKNYDYILTEDRCDLVVFDKKQLLFLVFEN